MGDLIQLSQRRAGRSRPEPERPAFFFDVACPLSYLAAERVERSLGEVEWVAVDGSVLARRRRGRAEPATLRTRAELRARALRLPLVWPENLRARTPRALRAAAFACELGAGPAFALAASRLAFCGGFDLEDPGVLAEAAAAAAIPLGACLQATREQWREDEPRAVARELGGRGVEELPAVRVGGSVVGGESALLAAAFLLQASGRVSGPLAPAG